MGARSLFQSELDAEAGREATSEFGFVRSFIGWLLLSFRTPEELRRLYLCGGLGATGISVTKMAEKRAIYMGRRSLFSVVYIEF
jgi:hypothetical protein